MAALYVTSTGEAAGRSALCAGLGRKLQARGRKVGFLKPGAAGGDADIEFMKQALGLQEPVDQLGPAADKVEEAYARVSQGKDVVLIEGAVAGSPAGKAIVVVPYERNMAADSVVSAAKALGDSLLGVVINLVPEHRIPILKAGLVRDVEASGIKVLGVLPDDRALFTITVGQLAEHIGGTILNSQDRSGELVESLMVGALSFDSATSYLATKANKAVITRGDHSDIQLAALNTSTRCLVLTDNIDPTPTIMSRALELDVPIVLVEKDTTSTLEALEGLFEKASLYEQKKADRLAQLVKQYLDLNRILEAI